MESAIKLAGQKCVEEGIDMNLYKFKVSEVDGDWLILLDPIHEHRIIGDGYTVLVSKVWEEVDLMANE